MALIARLVVAPALACVVAGCATTDARYGASTALFPLVAFCEPTGWTIDWSAADVPRLQAPERRGLDDRVPWVPQLPTHVSFMPDRLPPDVPDLAVPYLTALPERPGQWVDELPPSRGAPSLPARAFDVPQLAAPERPTIAASSPQLIELDARTRAFELGVRQGLPIDIKRACSADLALFTLPCLDSRADLREPARRNP